jgi:hypothetical protein
MEQNNKQPEQNIPQSDDNNQLASSKTIATKVI